MNTITLNETETGAARLLGLAAFAGDDLTVSPLNGGRNNRVFRVHSSAGLHLMKVYFHHPQDLRDRLANEVSFLRHLERAGCTVAPHLFACIPGEHLALLEYIDGVPVTPADLNADSVDQAVDFYFFANTDRASPAARALPAASEACFSIAEHLTRTQQRVDRLADIELRDDLDATTERFVHQELKVVWRGVRAEIEAEWPQPADREALLPMGERCLSPSDFGFHNALKEAGGRIRFLDFEYAGWDDPAKLICDFASQPDMPLPRALRNRFRNALYAGHRNPEALHRRITALRPLYQVKWACICLNDFLHTGRQRHDFTHGVAADHRARRVTQLHRARTMLARATTVFSRNPFD